MKSISIIFAFLFIVTSFVVAQDTLYVYKAGAVFSKCAISEIDSLTFSKIYPQPNTVSDNDGHTYSYKTIGTQTWMTENLKTTKYRNGESINNITVDAEWATATTGAWCVYDNNPTLGNKYGMLYNWYAVSDSRGIAPTGWHVATEAEWTTLENYMAANLDFSPNIAKALAATSEWNSYSSSGAIGLNLNLNNSSGFSALPGGVRGNGDGGIFSLLGDFGNYWTSTVAEINVGFMFEEGKEYAKFRYLDYRGGNISYSKDPKASGLSVRCIKDTDSPILTIPSTTATVTKDAGSIATVAITSNSNWTATSADSWVTLGTAAGNSNGTVNTSGTGNGTLIITTLTPNPTITIRTTTVTVNVSGGTPKTITVTQAAGDPNLMVSATVAEVGKEANSIAVVAVTSNSSWTAVSDQLWLTASPSPFTGNEVLTFTTTSDNLTLAPRTATVTLSASGVASKTITVTQSEKITLTFTPKSVLTEIKVYDKNNSATVTVGALTGVEPGDDVNVTATGTYADANVGTGKVITVVYSLAGAQAVKYKAPSNYTVNTGVITPKPLTVTAQADIKVYDQNTNSLLVPVVTGDLVQGDVVNTLTQSFDSYTVGVAKVLTPLLSINDGNGGNNYSITTVNAIGQITTAPVLAIGDLYLGGKIAYLDASGIHGFVCALTDQSSSVAWCNGSFVITGATNGNTIAIENSGVYGITKSNGRKNTDAIIAVQGVGTYAASICATLTMGGATAGDWYLPSEVELNQLYLNKTILGGFSNSYYWSSRERSEGDIEAVRAWMQLFSDGSQYFANKTVGYRVRAIRAF